MSGELLDLSTKRESAPAKAWRNWWQTLGCMVTCNLDTGELIPRGPGEVFCGTRVFPSAEVAEAFARDAQRMDTDAQTLPLLYLGAYPEGESPP